MAYTLKATGIATLAKAVVAVDQDGTLKEFVNGWTPGAGLIKHANVTTSGTASFRSAGTKNYFQTFSNSGVPEGIAFDTNIDLTTRTSNKGMTVVVVMAGAYGDLSSGSSVFAHLHYSANQTADSNSDCLAYARETSPGKGAIYVGGGPRGQTTTTVPNDGTTAFTLAAEYMHDGTDSRTGYTAGGRAFACLEANEGSTASFEPSSPSGGGYQPSGVLALTGVGGFYQPDDHATTPNAAFARACPGKYLLWAVFDDLLTEAELQSIHDDWFGTLLDEGVTHDIDADPLSISGSLAVSGDIASEVKKWRVPTTASESTTVHVVVLTGTSPTYTIAAQGAATVDASGNADIAATGTLGTKALAFVHNYDDDDATTSIYGGAGIATLIDAG